MCGKREDAASAAMMASHTTNADHMARSYHGTTRQEWLDGAHSNASLRKCLTQPLGDKFSLQCTVIVARMSHRKWRENKQQLI